MTQPISINPPRLQNGQTVFWRKTACIVIAVINFGGAWEYELDTGTILIDEDLDKGIFVPAPIVPSD